MVNIKDSIKKIKKVLLNLTRNGQQNRNIPIYLFCYHKTGTVLLFNIFRQICVEFGWKFEQILGRCEEIPFDADVVLFCHSLVDFGIINKPYLGIHVIRDPRDIIVSGYLYHKRCNEEWCITNLDYSNQIRYPIPFSQQYKSKKWRKNYLTSLGGKSYQQNLIELNETQGLLFEMRHCGMWTIKSMMDWDYRNPKVMEIKFEELMTNFDTTFKKIFEHLNFSNYQTSKSLKIASQHDLNRMTEEQLKKNSHISSRKTTKWRKYFKDVHKKEFKKLFGNDLIQLCYEKSNEW